MKLFYEIITIILFTTLFVLGKNDSFILYKSAINGISLSSQFTKESLLKHEESKAVVSVNRALSLAQNEFQKEFEKATGNKYTGGWILKSYELKFYNVEGKSIHLHLFQFIPNEGPDGDNYVQILVLKDGNVGKLSKIKEQAKQAK